MSGFRFRNLPLKKSYSYFRIGLGRLHRALAFGQMRRVLPGLDPKGFKTKSFYSEYNPGLYGLKLPLIWQYKPPP